MRIVTDCAADLPREEINNLGIKVAPLFIQFPEGEVNSEDLEPDDFYQRLKNMAPKIPTTAQPSPGIFERLYKEVLDIEDEIISIHISSGLSGTINSARMAATKFVEKRVEIVDSLTLSGGQRFQVLAAANMAKLGEQKEQILERLSKIREATEVIYTLETLEFLQRGGRIGRVQALAGALLHIKPIIKVEKSDGKYSTVGKERTLEKALIAIIDNISGRYKNDTPLWISIMHGQLAEQAQALGSLIQEKVNVKKLETLRISPVLGVHTGPGIAGMAVVPFDLMDVSS